MVDPTDDLTVFARSLARAPTPGAAALARKAAMQALLLAEVRRRPRRRGVLRAAAAAALVLAALALAFRRPERAPRAHALRHVDFAAVGAPGARWSFDYAAVPDDGKALARFTAQRTLPAEIFVDDDELLHLLAAAGRPTGLVRVGDRAFVTDDIVDEPASAP